MKKQIVETRQAQAWVMEGNIIKVQMHAGAKITLKDAKEDLELERGLAEEMDYTLLLVDISKIDSMSREARLYYSRRSPEAPGNKARAVALLARSSLSRVIANFFLGLNRARMPIRMFTDEEEAVRWLKGFGDR